VIIATGQRTGNTAMPEEILTIKGATRLPVVVGSGVTEDNIEEILSLCDGVIVASSLKRDGVWWNEIDPERVRRFMDRARAARP
jgi:predicted TIM-barrel enzyme